MRLRHAGHADRRPRKRAAFAAAPAPPPASTAGDVPAGRTRFSESFVVERAAEDGWRALADFALVAACQPGAQLIEHDGRHVKGRLAVKLGPMRAVFSGSAGVELDRSSLSGRIRGAGTDGASGSRAKANAAFRVFPEASRAASRVSIAVDYNLQGPLAQFSRSALAHDLGRRLVGEFAASLNARLQGKT